ncbi:MAG: DUF960 family protein [Clostridia bacterium]
MFENDRYMTNGVKNTIPQYTQNLIWFLIETMKVEEKDYLQVFKLSATKVDGTIRQKIAHIQEQPEYRKEYIILLGNAITAKLFVIDDGDHTTMLMAEEY